MLLRIKKYEFHIMKPLELGKLQDVNSRKQSRRAASHRGEG